MTLGILPARGTPSLAALDERAALDVDAYRKSFDVVDLGAAPGRVGECRAVRVMNLSGVLPALRWRVAHGVPYVLTLGYDHAALSRFHKRPGRALAWSVLRRVAAAHARLVLCSAEGLARRWRLRDRLEPHRLRVIPNGADLSLFFPAPTGYPRRVAYVGRLSPEKNLLALLEAAASAQVELDLIGEGPERAALARRAWELGVTAYLAGRLPYGEVAARLRWASAAALVSWEEGSPKTVAEYMATGLPIVVSTAVPDMEEAPVIRVAPGSVDAIRAGLGRALRDEGLGRAAREWAVAHRSWERLIGEEIQAVKGAVVA